MKRTNEEWLNDLAVPGERRDEALEDLRKIVLKGLPYALNQWLPTSDPRFEPLTEEVAQNTLLRVLERLDTFEGRSQFTTWVNKIAVRIALSELRRKQWQNISLDELLEGEDAPLFTAIMENPQTSTPEQVLEKKQTMQLVKQIISEELTDRQRQALVATAVKGMPLEEVARRMGTNRNALYKLLHDARLGIRRKLAAAGLTPTSILESLRQDDS